MKRIIFATAIAVAWLAGGVTHAADIITIPASGVVRGEPGSTINVTTAAVPDDYVGADCVARVTGANNESVHQGNDLIVASGATSGVVADFESVASASVNASLPLTLGDTVTVSVRLGESSRISSGGLTVVVDCTSTTVTTTEPICIPEGTPVVDTETGVIYYYKVPGLVGVDSCGNDVPDICVEWPDGQFSRLWSVADCTPTDTTVPHTTTMITTPPPTLPDTGAENWAIAAIGSLMLAGGTGVLMAARRR
jgi:LPXTG-motif cell wall-anchored protein